MPFRYVSSSQKPNEESQDAARCPVCTMPYCEVGLLVHLHHLQGMATGIPMKSEAQAQIIQYIDSQYHVPSSDPDQILFKAINILIALIIALYLFGVFEQLGKSKIWVAKVDPKGYWQPNVNVVLPIFATAHGIALSVALGLMHFDFGGPVRPSTVSFEAGALLLLHCLNWSKTWVTLYAMPCNAEGPHLAQPPTRLSSRFAKPYLFNSLVFLGYAAPVLIGLPLMILQHRSINSAHQGYLSLIGSLESLGNQTLADAPLSSWLSNPTVALKIKNLKSGGEHTHHYSKLFAIMLISIHSISLLFLLWATQAILRTLFNQVKVHRRCILNRRKVLGLELSSTKSHEPKQEKEPGFDKSDSASLDSRGNGFIVTIEELEKSEPKKNDKAFHWLDWKVVTPCLRRGTEVGAELWKSDLIRHLDEEDQVLQSKLEAEYLTLRQYTANTMWQALLIFMISGCYITMGVAYVFNWEDAPIRTSYAQLCVNQLKYAGMIWTVGGFFLATLTAVVASSPLPKSPSPPTETSSSHERPESIRFEMRLHTERTLPFHSHAF
ncbi:hypothetical protein MJO29_010550 [Puccinia striiformis f. sp. tritici]|nr:hypothetical protein MJO29_010550 [Puccinia striiformis f. sp. tritici]